MKAPLSSRIHLLQGRNKSCSSQGNRSWPVERISPVREEWKTTRRVLPCLLACLTPLTRACSWVKVHQEYHAGVDTASAIYASALHNGARSAHVHIMLVDKKPPPDDYFRHVSRASADMELVNCLGTVAALAPNTLEGQRWCRGGVVPTVGDIWIKWRLTVDAGYARGLVGTQRLS